MPTEERRVPGERPGSDPRESAASRLVPRAGQHRELNRLTDLAARLLSTPSSPVAAQVSLLTHVQTIAAGSGLPEGAVGSQSALADSLCTVTRATGGPLVVGEAQADDRVAHLPPVTSGAVGAYLGVPLVAAEGVVVGALCAFGPVARLWSAYDVALLEEIAGAVMAQLELQALSAEYRTSRLRWEVAIEAAGIGTFEWDLRTGRLDWDERMQALFGYLPGEFEARADQGFSRIHPEDRPALDAAIDAAVGESGDFRAEYRVVWPDGTQRWISARGRAVTGEDGTVVGLLGTAHDITDLRTTRDEAARLLETMATGFLAVDRDWRVTYLNREGMRVTGLTAARIVGRVLWDVFPGLEDSEFGRRYKQAAVSGEPAEIEAYYAHLDAWFEVRAVPDTTGLSLYFLEVTGRHQDQARAAAATGRLELLDRVSEELAAAGLAIEDAVAELARVVVPVLADWCVVSLVDGGHMRDVGYWHRDETHLPLIGSYVAERLTGRRNLGAVQEVRETLRPVVMADGVLDAVLPTLGSQLAREALLSLAPRSLVAVPLIARGHITGVLSMLRGSERPAMSDDELTTAREVASRASLALDNARLYTEQRSLAEGLQRSLLTTPPEPEHWRIAVRYTPAAEVASVGGDWFDSFLQADGATVLVIGDVMGHDTVAAAAMGQLRGLLRGIGWHSGGSPAEVLRGLDAAMEGLQVHTTATAVVARLEQSGTNGRGVARLRWSNAGHPPPMVVTTAGVVTVLSSDDSDLLLGIDPRRPRREAEIVLERGSTVLLYTDGLVERRGQDLDDGLALLRGRLAELAHLPLEELCDELLARMLPTPAQDDVALVAVRLHA